MACQVTGQLRIPGRGIVKFSLHGMPVVNSATKSVEEMSTVIPQTLAGKP